MEKINLEEYKKVLSERKNDKKHKIAYWQERCLHYIEELQIQNPGHKKILFRYFKYHCSTMESICEYVLEIKPANPFPYILTVYRSRHDQDYSSLKLKNARIRQKAKW